LVVFLLLYLCALNSKEMALTFPFVLVGYEWAYRGTRSSVEQKLGGRAEALAPLVLVSVLCLLSLYGKSFGAGAIVRNPAYQPVFTLGRFMTFQKAALRDLFGSFGTPGWQGVVAIWTLVTYLAWRRRRPVLRFLWASMLLTPLPIAFLTGRTQGALYVPLAGWAIFAAVIFVDFAEVLANVLAQEPLFRRLGQGAVFAMLIAAGVWFWAARMLSVKAMYITPAAAVQGVQTWNVIQQLRALHPQVRPHSQVVFLNDPFEDWDMTFIGTLWFADRSIEIYNQNHQHLSPAELASMDHVFDFQNGKLVQVK